MSVRVQDAYPVTPCQEVISAFLRPWIERSDVLGALLVGSYATGLETTMSDIDICIVMSDLAPRWQRGHAIISGYLIEYAAYPIRRIRQLWESDIADARRLRMRMLGTGRIVNDKDGTIQRLQTEARALLALPLPVPAPEKIELEKYFLWDQLDNLRDMERLRDPGFAYAYYACLQKLIDFYASTLGVEIPRPNRIRQFLNEPDFRVRYGIAEFPDKEFTRIFVEAMIEPCLVHIESLTDHVHSVTGGFDVAHWELTGEVTY